MEAAWRSETEIVKVLVEAGANLDLQDKVCHIDTHVLLKLATHGLEILGHNYVL